MRRNARLPSKAGKSRVSRMKMSTQNVTCFSCLGMSVDASMRAAMSAARITAME